MTEGNQTMQEFHRLASDLKDALNLHRYLFLFFIEPTSEGEQFLPNIPNTDGNLQEHVEDVSVGIGDANAKSDDVKATKDIFRIVLRLSEELDLRAHRADDDLQRIKSDASPDIERWVPRVKISKEGCLCMARIQELIIISSSILRDSIKTRRAHILADRAEALAIPKDLTRWAPGLVAWSYVHELDEAIDSFELLGEQLSAELDTPNYDPYVWVKQADIVRGLANTEFELDSGSLSRACGDGEIKTNGMKGRQLRVNTDSFLSWYQPKENRRRKKKNEGKEEKKRNEEEEKLGMAPRRTQENGPLTQKDIDHAHALIIIAIIKKRRRSK